MDAAADRGQITGGLVDGPLAFDNAVSEQAAQEKHIVSPVAGKANILLLPIWRLEHAGKTAHIYVDADAAGIVLGARIPIILTSRADNLRTRLASAAVAVLMAHAAPSNSPKSDRGRVMAMENLIFVVNSGSSSIKFPGYTAMDRRDPALLFKGQVEGIDSAPHQSLI